MTQRVYWACLAALAMVISHPACAAGAADNPTPEQKLAAAFVTGDAKVFAGGEPLRLFLTTRFRGRRIDDLLVFMPHGVLAEIDNGRATMARWRSISGGFELSINGKTAPLRLAKLPSGRAGLTGSGLTYVEIPRLTEASLAGRYETMSAGGSGGGPMLSVSHYGRKALVLTPDHRFVLGSSSSTTATDKSTVVAAARDGGISGKWRYEPASYTLTLEPDNGKPALSGPTFPSFLGALSNDRTTDWMVLGADTWWRDGMEAKGH